MCQAQAVRMMFGSSEWAVRKFKLAPPPEPDPDDIQPVNLRFRCAVCGAEVTMTAAQGDEPDAPRHCREDMDFIPG